MTKILIVDDNQQNLYMLQVLLEGNGYHVEMAHDGAEALEIARREPPFLIVADILMPVMDGFTLCREWQQDERLKEIPFVFYTATYTDPKDEVFALSLGAERFIVKPIEPDAFVDILREVIREAEAGQLRAPDRPLEEEPVYLKHYSERLVKKLEDKVAQVERANRRLNALYEASIGLTAIKPVDDLVSHVLCTVVEAMDFSNGTYFAYDEKQEVFRLQEAVGFPDRLVKTFRSELVLELGEERGLVGLVGASREPLIVTDTQAEPHWISLNHSIRSALFVPVIYKDQLLGVANFLSTKVGEFSQEDARNVMTLANNLGVAIENAALMENLRQSEERYRTLFENVPTGLYRTTPAGEILDANPAMVKMLGYEDCEALRQVNAVDFFVDPEARRREQSQLKQKGAVRGFEAQLRRQDGEIIWVLDTVRAVRDDQGGLVYEGGMQEITARKEARDALRSEKEYSDSLIAAMQEGLSVLDADGVHLSVNPAFCQMTGFSEEELVGTGVPHPYWPPEAYDEIEKAFQRTLQGEFGDFELTFMRKNGDRFPVIVTPSQVRNQQGDVVSYFAVVRDITQRKRAEQMLRRYANRLKTLHEIDRSVLTARSPRETAWAALGGIRKLIPCMGAGVATFDLDAGWATVIAVDADRGSALEEGMRFPLDDVDATESQILVENDLSATSQPLTPLARALQADGVRSYIAAPLIAQDEWLGVLRLHSDKPAAFTSEHVGIVREVTAQLAVAIQQARLSAALEAERRRLEITVEYVPEGILLLNAEHRILLVNPTAREYLNILADVGPGDLLISLAGHPLEELLTPLSEGLWHEFELPDPPLRTFEVLARPVVEGQRHSEGWVLTMRDVTEERKAQERVHRQERLAAVGQLAGGIAHDFRNFLSPIVIYAHLALRNPDLPPELRPAMETIISESHQATNLVQQILDFSRCSMMEMQPLDLKPFVKEAVRVLERTLPENMRLLLDMGPGECVVKADPTRIQQVLVNLALNARDAMPEGGDLRISLSEIVLAPDEEPPVVDMDPGQWVSLALSDTGCGMTEEVQAHLFEPFFSTKELGQGAGLGLAQVLGIVDQHEGYIGVETEVGEGTTFQIYLPAYTIGEMEEAGAAVEEIPQGRGETILLVEDEDSVRQAIKEALQSLGYRILPAVNGREALEMCQAVLPDLVITDLVMPEKGGEMLIQSLREQYPGLEALVITGYAVKAEVLKTLRCEGFMDVIQKPIEIHRLAHVVRQALDRGGTD